MPAPANIVFLIRLFRHERNLRILRVRREETIDIDVAKPLCKRDMVILAGVLIAEEDDAMLRKRLLDRLKIRVGQCLDINAGDLSAHAIDGCNLHLLVPPQASSLEASELTIRTFPSGDQVLRSRFRKTGSKAKAEQCT